MVTLPHGGGKPAEPEGVPPVGLEVVESDGRRPARSVAAPPAATPGVDLAFATADDVPLMLDLVKDLAAYEQLAHEVCLATLSWGDDGDATALGAGVSRESPPYLFVFFFCLFATQLGCGYC